MLDIDPNENRFYPQAARVPRARGNPYTWHRRFACLPRRLEDGRLTWLRFTESKLVERQVIVEIGDNGTERLAVRMARFWVYREPEGVSEARRPRPPRNWYPA